MGLLRGDAVHPEVPNGPLHGGGGDVAHRDPGPLLHQVAHQAVAHLPDPADHGMAAVQAGRVPEVAGHRLHGVEHAVGGGRRRVARAAQGPADPGHVPSLPPDQVHVRLRGTHVLGRDVAAPQGVDEAGVGPDEGLAAEEDGVADDHGLAPSEVEPGRGRLVGHPPGQAQDVLQGVVLRGVGVEPGATQGGAEAGRVDGHDGAQPARPVVAEDNLLVVVATDAIEDLHSRRGYPRGGGAEALRGGRSTPAPGCSTGGD